MAFAAGMLRLFRRHPIVTGAFALSSLLAAGFLVHFLVGVFVWQPRAAEPIRPWMTVGYIARARGLHPREIDELAGLPLPERGKPFTLAEIAADRGVPVAEIIASVEAAIAELRAREVRDDAPAEGGGG